MTEVLLPTWIVPEEETQEWLDEGSSVFPAAFAPGIAQRQSFGGLRLKMSRRHTVRGEEKAQLLSILQETRGRFKALRTKVHFALRGSGLGTELLTNGTFANGTTGWSSGTDLSISVADRILRSHRTANQATQRVVLESSVATTVTAFAPYILRTFVTTGRGFPVTANMFRVRAGSSQGGNAFGETFYSDFGLLSHTFVPSGTTAYATPLVDGATLNWLHGDYVLIPYTSLSRTALVDNGTNLLLRSDELEHAAWTATGLSARGADVLAAPNGTTTADTLVENSSAGAHGIDQSQARANVAADLCSYGYFRRGSGTRNVSMSAGNNGSNFGAATFDLSNGTIIDGPTNGGTATNARAFVVDAGGGWYFCCVIASLPAAATAHMFVNMTDGTSPSYTGDGASSIAGWRLGMAVSSVPTRGAQTTSAATSGTSQTGNALHLKGLPASTSGLLLPGDYAETKGEIKQATAALNSDAAGLGYLQFESTLVRSPANDDPVSIVDPMGKFLVSNIKIDNRFGQHAIVTYDLEHIYE
jgi:hypothetical protein